MAAAPLHSFREGDVYDQISRFEQRQGSREEEEDDGHSPSPPPGPAMELPSRLYECKSVVRALDEKEGCGVLELSGGGETVLSFFLLSHCAGARLPAMGDTVLSNARLVDGRNKVPFLSAAVWYEGETLPDSLLMAVMADKAPLEEMARHVKLAEYMLLMLELDGKKRDGDEQEGRRRKKVKFDDGYRSSQDKEGNGQVCPDEKELLEEQAEAETEPTEELELVEEFVTEGLEAKVEKFMNKRVGVLTVTHPENQKLVKVLFNISQVWDGASPFLETHPSWSLKKFLDSAKTIRLNARDVSNSHCPLRLQASAVWVSDSPPDYLGKSLLPDLQLQLRRHLFSLTSQQQYRTNPLAGETARAVGGTVVEYFSREMGFIKLDQEEGNTVLFHLNQVWERKAGSTAPYKVVQSQALAHLLPLGTAVMVGFRRLPAKDISALKYQATVVWKQQPEEVPEDTDVPLEHINRYTRHEDRVGLLEELDHYHDNMKALLCLDLPPTDHKFRPVQTILNGLPFEWQAEIVAGIDLEFGIIQISNVDGMEFNIGPGVKFLYAMFHIEDVWDSSGIKNPTVNMPMLMNNFVDLTARPICSESSPDKVLELQRKLVEEKRAFGEIPLLQAVVVCVKKFPYDEVDVSRISQPTVLSVGPGSFGLDITEFYLNAGIGHRLDLKLQRYLNIPNNLQFLYERVMKKIDLRDDKMLMDFLRKIDSDQGGSWSHGSLGRVQRLPIYLTMPRNVAAIQSCSNQLVRPVLLHSRHFKTDCGVVELVVNNGGAPLKTFAFFEMSQYVSFKPVNYFVTDLTNIIQMPAKETFHAHMELAFPDCPVPYVVLAIWNEDSRKMFGAAVPQPALEVPARKYFESCKETVVDIVRVASISLPPVQEGLFGSPMQRGRGGRGRGRGGGRGGGGDGEDSEMPPLPPWNPPAPPINPSTIIWQDIVTDFYGVVLRVVNKNYALAAGFMANGRDDPACIPFQILFDSCDLFVEDRTCEDQGKSVEDVVEVGDFIRFNALRVETERKQPSRNLRYLATGVVTAKTAELIKTTNLPEAAPKISFMNQLSQSKIDNFKAIAGVLNTVKLDEKEEEIFQKLESGQLAAVKELKKCFITVTKDKESEEEDALIKLFKEQHPFGEEEVAARKEDNLGVNSKNNKKNKKGLAEKMDDYVPEPVDEDILASEKALKEKALEKAKERAEEREKHRLAEIERLEAKREAKKKAKAAQAEALKIAEQETVKKLLAEPTSSLPSSSEGDKDTPTPATPKSKETPKQPTPKSKETSQEPTPVKPADEGEMEKLCEELTPKQTRKLVMAYMEIVSKLPEKNPRNKIDPQSIAKNANLEKDTAFLEKFFLVFGQRCSAAVKGMKVGSVFVTQTQVKAVLSRGIMEPEHILKEGEQEVQGEQTGDIFSDYSPDKLRKLLLSFLKLMDGQHTWYGISKDHEVPIEEAMKLLLAITERCKEVAKGDIREVLPFKLQAIFVSKAWAVKIFKYGWTGQEEEEEIEEITLDSD